MAQFSKLHASIIGAFATAKAKAEKLEADSITKQNAEIQKLVDAHVLACSTTKAEYLKGNSKTNEARGEVKALFDTLVSKEYISKNSAQQYAQCFWIAFETNVPFSRDLVNKKAEAKAEANTKAEALTLTLQKALHQCTLLNQTLLKGALLDAIVEFIPDFTESAK